MIGVKAASMRDDEGALVEGVDWRVAAGDFWCVCGAYGSGKSDFLMLAAGLVAPTEGMVRLFGEEGFADEEAQLRLRLKVGFVFDDGSLFNNLTVAENISLPLRYRGELSTGEIADRTAALLELGELTPWANSTPGTLGRNWRKRAGLLRALALQPDLLLLDAPLAGADARHAAWWLDVLAKLAAGHPFMPGARAATVVVTADDAQPWRGRARQFARLHEGKFEAVTKEMLADTITKG
jgi:ABC-type transporter Mla maintaining outer membrane lipid asymmetry ATPase subunit MlaF